MLIFVAASEVYTCLNPIVEWVQLTIQKLLKYEKSFVEINVFLILILSNRRCGPGGIRSLGLCSLSVRLHIPVTEQVENNNLY
jgi:hypothetical protein